MFDSLLDENKTINWMHFIDKKFGTGLCKPGFVRVNMKTGACFESGPALIHVGFINGE